MFDTQDDDQSPPSAQPINGGALTEPNPRPGIRLTLVRTVDDVPEGAEVLLLGSMFQYDEAKPADEFEVEYRQALITVQRCEVEHSWRESLASKVRRAQNGPSRPPHPSRGGRGNAEAESPSRSRPSSPTKE